MRQPDIILIREGDIARRQVRVPNQVHEVREEAFIGALKYSDITVWMRLLKSAEDVARIVYRSIVAHP